MSFDCPAEVHLRRHMQLHTVGGRVENADVVSVVVGVLGVLATLVVDSGGGAVEEVFGSFLTLGRLCVCGDAGVGLERQGRRECDAVGCCCGGGSARLTREWGN